MRIVMVSDVFYPHIDGITTTLLNYIDSLAKKGHKILVIAPSYGKNKKMAFHKNIEIKRIDSVKCLSYPDYRIPKFKIFTFLKHIKKFKPDIIHSHTQAVLGWMAYIAKKVFKLPFLITYHTNIADFYHYFSIYKLMGVDKLIKRIKRKREGGVKKKNKTKKKDKRWIIKKEKIIESLKRIKRFSSFLNEKVTSINKKAIWKYNNFYCDRADIITAPSFSVKKELIKYGIKKPVKVISNGIKIKEFKKKTNYRTNSGILHTGRLGYEKNIEILLKAIKVVNKEFPKARLTIVGEGPAYLKLIEMQKELGLENNVSFMGMVPYEKIKKIYRNYDFFATASTIETLGMVVLEAMSSGLPIVGVNKLAVPELVKNNKNGFIAKPFNEKDIAKAMIKLLKNQILRERMGKASLRIAEEHELNKVILELEEVYTSLLS